MDMTSDLSLQESCIAALRHMGIEVRALIGKTNELEAENKKLRELCADMMGFFEDGDWCVKCERALDCQEQEQYEDECLMRFVFRDRMRELGVRLDG